MYFRMFLRIAVGDPLPSTLLPESGI